MNESVAREGARGLSSGPRRRAADRHDRIQQPAFWLLLLAAEAAWLGGLVYLFILIS